MSDRQDTAATLAWCRSGTEALELAVSGLSDAGLREPSRLPGWSRAHVLAHVARNAEALVNLLTWARTGVETPMYASSGQRDADIASGARFPAQRLRAELSSSARAFETAAGALPAAAWEVTVRTAQGRQVPARQVPWMRVREVWLHLVDLEVGRETADLPRVLVRALLDEVAASFSARPDVPALQLTDTGSGRTWSVDGDGAATHWAAPAATLLAALVGRPYPHPADLSPAVARLPRWL